MKITRFLILTAVLLLIIADASAQCAMCQATAESSLDAGSSAAAGINKGVMYLFFMPWIIMGTIAYFWWREQKKAQQ
ncbi:MAG: hypothetical protein KIS94_00125 [Chitinophagales bacterium]|nr:hypothetical protein [Chitinophagales bacterium]